MRQPMLGAGVDALNNGNALEAVRLLERAVAAAPASRLALLHLGNAQNTLSSDEAASEAALATMRRLLRINEADALARWSAAMLLGQMSRLEESVAELDLLLATEPSYPDGWRALGTVLSLQSLDAMREARRKANVSARIGDWVEDPVFRATLQSTAGANIDRGIAALERARQMDPRSADAAAMLNFALRLGADIAPDAAMAA